MVLMNSAEQINAGDIAESMSDFLDVLYLSED